MTICTAVSTIGNLFSQENKLTRTDLLFWNVCPGPVFPWKQWAFS